MMDIPIENLTIINHNTIEDVQLQVCNAFEGNIVNPLYVAILCIAIRWFVIYRLIDEKKNPRLFRILETGLDVGAIMCISISIIWLKVF